MSRESRKHFAMGHQCNARILRAKFTLLLSIMQTPVLAGRSVSYFVKPLLVPAPRGWEEVAFVRVAAGLLFPPSALELAHFFLLPEHPRVSLVRNHSVTCWRMHKTTRHSILLRTRLLAILVLAAGPALASETVIPDPQPEEATREESGYLEQLELRSIVNLPGGTLFSLRDPEHDRSFWIEEGEARHGIQVLAFDPERQVLAVRYGPATREIPLSHARIRDIEELEEEERERVRARWRERVEERRAFQKRWQEAVQDSPELREIEDHTRDIVNEMRELREALAEAQEGSAEYDRLRDQQRFIAEEYRLLESYSRDTVAGHPAFEPEDVETVELLQQLVRYAWPEFEVTD